MSIFLLLIIIYAVRWAAFIWHQPVRATSGQRFRDEAPRAVYRFNARNSRLAVRLFARHDLVSLTVVHGGVRAGQLQKSNRQSAVALGALLCASGISSDARLSAYLPAQ